MAKEEKPPSYQRRILDTKGLAQRLDLNYLLRPHWLRVSRRYLTWGVALVAMLAAVPFIVNLRGGKKAFTSGPVSRAHAIFDKDCQSCHVVSFEHVRDEDCKKCHDGPAHQLSVAAPGAPRCAECHVEHRGTRMLAEMEDWNCTKCHADLARHGEQVRLQKTSLNIRKFSPDQHPAFSAQSRPDTRPLKMNHAAHMPATLTTLRGVKLPLGCMDCHEMAPRGTAFDLVPVNFNSHCSGCHARELEFDLYQLLGPNVPPAPHAKSTSAIRDYVYNSYRKALTANPSLWRQPLGGGFVVAAATPEAWVEAMAGQSLIYLFDRKCTYCHEIESKDGIYPVVRKVNQISGQYSPAKVEGVAWFQHGQFSHRVHRIVDCGSCHTTARASVKTSDVLIPPMQSCLPCHGSSGTTLDHCTQCHTYHDMSRETARQRRTTQELIRNFTPPARQR
jgi:hypothetical protein